MTNDPTPDLVVECNAVFEYGQAMAFAAESLLRYPDRIANARSENERAHIRREHAEILKRAIRAHEIAFIAMTAPNESNHRRFDLRILVGNVCRFVRNLFVSP